MLYYTTFCSRLCTLSSLKRLAVLALVIGGCCFGAKQAEAVPVNAWHNVGSDHFSPGIAITNVPIAIDSDGTIYVAYADENENQKATVMKYDGSDWSVVGSALFTNRANDLSLAVDASGSLYLAYVDASVGSRATVMKFAGSRWLPLGNTAFSNSGVQGTVIALHPDGTPYVTFIDVSNNDAPTVMKLNGETWERVGTPYAARGGALSMAFTTSGTPYVAFSDVEHGYPTVISFNGSAWAQVGDPIIMSLYANSPLAISPSGVPHIVVEDLADVSEIKVLAFTDGNWSQLGGSFYATSTGDTVIAFAADGTPYVSFRDLDTSKGTVISYTGGSWSEVGSPLFTSPTQTPLLRMVIGPNGGPYVVSSDSTGSDYRLTVQAYLSTVPGQVTGVRSVLDSADAAALSWTALTDTGGRRSPDIPSSDSRLLAGGIRRLLLRKQASLRTWTAGSLWERRIRIAYLR